MEIKHSLKTGFSFGLTSGIITTLGLLVGLSSTTHSEIVVFGGILTIAIADALSDAMGIHIAEESENKHTRKEVWTATVCTFFTKFFFALTFIVPILLFSLQTAVIISVGWGFSLLGIFSFYIAREQKKSSWKVISEHLIIALVVITATHFVGRWINATFIS